VTKGGIAGYRLADGLGLIVKRRLTSIIVSWSRRSATTQRLQLRKKATGAQVGRESKQSYVQLFRGRRRPHLVSSRGPLIAY